MIEASVVCSEIVMRPVGIIKGKALGLVFSVSFSICRRREESGSCTTHIHH